MIAGRKSAPRRQARQQTAGKERKNDSTEATEVILEFFTNIHNPLCPLCSSVPSVEKASPLPPWNSVPSVSSVLPDRLAFSPRSRRNTAQDWQGAAA